MFYEQRVCLMQLYLKYEYIFLTGFVRLYMLEKLIHNCFFSDEAWFSLRGEVNSQNNRFWSAENPGCIQESPLHDERIGFWCAICTRRII
jgi:hypothetical protein